MDMEKWQASVGLLNMEYLFVRVNFVSNNL